MNENIHPQPTNINELGAELPPPAELAIPTPTMGAQEAFDAAGAAEATPQAPEHVPAENAAALGGFTFRMAGGILNRHAAGLPAESGTFDKLRKIRDDPSHRAAMAGRREAREARGARFSLTTPSESDK